LSCYKEKSGTSLLDLFHAANKLNLPAVPLKIDLDKLCKFKSPSIAFIDGNHFLVVHGCKKDKVIIQNPPDPPFAISKKDFKKRWNGEALVFSEKLKKKMASEIAKATAPPK